MTTLTTDTNTRVAARPQPPARVTKPLMLRVGCSSLFFWSYVLSYSRFVPELYDTWRLGQRIDVNSPTTYFLWLLAVLPAVFLRPALRYTSDFFVYIQYFLVYVPSLWVAFNATRPEMTWDRAYALDLTLFASMMIIVLLSRIRSRRAPPRVADLSPSRIRALVIVAFALFMLVGFALKWQFNLVGFDEIYELRESAGNTLTSGGIGLTGYYFSWLNGALLPTMLCIGVLRRSRTLMVASTAMYVGLYALWGSKASLFAPLAVYVVSRLCRQFEGHHLAAFAALFSSLLVVPYSFALAEPEVQALTESWYLYVIHQRTFNSSALLIPQYLEFFSVNPNTFGSHITGINLMVPYPFDMDVPRLVGMFQYGGLMTANVNYWGQDGIAAFGLLGIPMISLVVGGVFWTADRILCRVPIALAVPSMTFMASNLIDTSIFTTLISGGLLLVILMLPMLLKSRPRGAH